MKAVAVPAIFCGLLLAGCSRQDQAKANADAREAGREIKQEAKEIGHKIDDALKPSPERRDYQEHMQTRLDKLDAQIDELQTKADAAHGRHKAELERQIAELRRERDDTHGQYDKLKGSSEEVWQKLKVDMDHAADKLQEGYEKLKRKLNS